MSEEPDSFEVALTKAFEHAVKSIRFLSTFGKVEMELAADRIVQKAEKAGTWNITVSATDMSNDEMEKTGFFELNQYGWLKRLDKSNFKLRPEFVARILSKISLTLEPLKP